MFRGQSIAFILTVSLLFFACSEKSEAPVKKAEEPEVQKEESDSDNSNAPKITIDQRIVQDGDSEKSVAIRSIRPKLAPVKTHRVDYPPDALPFEVIADDEKLQLVRFPEYKSAAKLTSNGYGLLDKPSREAFLIDPGVASVRMMRFWIERNEAKLVGLVATHGHIDHVGGVADLKRSYPDVRFVAPVKDAKWMSEPDRINFPASIATWPPAPDRTVVGGDRIGAGSLSLQTIDTPGHTNGSVCYWLKERGWLFSGDTLFRSSIGRTDLPHSGTMVSLIATIKKKLAKLPDKTKVFTGHGPFTTLGDERKNNPFLTGGKANIEREKSMGTAP